MHGDDGDDGDDGDGAVVRVAPVVPQDDLAAGICLGTAYFSLRLDHGRRLLAGLHGEIGIAAQQDLTLLRRIVGRYRPEHLTLDLSEVTFFDSAGVACIALLARDLRRAGGSLSLTRVPLAVDRVIRVCGLGWLLPPAHRAGLAPARAT